MRAPFIYISLIFLVIGYGINISNARSGVKYFGTFWIVAGSYAGFPVVVASCVAFPESSPLVIPLRLSNNLAGQYKRGIGMALHIGKGKFGGAKASNTYRSQDSPRFILGRTSSYSGYCCIYFLMLTSDALEFMFVGIGLICVPIAVLSRIKINNINMFDCI